MELNRKEKFVLCLVVALISIILLITAIAFYFTSGKKCELSSDLPTILLPVYLSSDDQQARVGFSGYIRYEYGDVNPNRSSEYDYMSLKMDKVEQSGEGDEARLKLFVGCADITFGSVTSMSEKMNCINHLEMKLVKANGERNWCEMSPVTIKWNKTSHFKSDDVQQLSCWSAHNEKIATLVVNFLEFEYNMKREL